MKFVIRIFLIFIVLLLLVAGVGYYFVFFPNTEVYDDGIVFIRKEDTFDRISGILKEKRYLKNESTFRKVAELKKYPQRIKAGRYRIRYGMNNNALVNMLRAGRQEPVRFTFNNLRTLPQLAATVEQQLEMDSLSFLLAVSRPELLQELGFTPGQVAGMFIPNTYEVYWDIDPEAFVRKMAKEYRKFWNDTRRTKARKAGLSPMDVTILASIVEEETAAVEEYPVIAGVYVNRLKEGIPLAACPTLKFALGDFTLKRILNKHLEVESPYNTYKYKGLPPGPVRIPSIQVIEAVLNYKKHDYLYFCARSDFSGRHYFSRTLRQHNEYARQYHQALNRRRIYQ